MGKVRPGPPPSVPLCSFYGETQIVFLAVEEEWGRVEKAIRGMGDRELGRLVGLMEQLYERGRMEQEARRG